MTAPLTRPASALNGSSASGRFGAPKPVDHRTTALQSAVAVLRGKQPVAKAEDVLDMAEAFYQFLNKK